MTILDLHTKANSWILLRATLIPFPLSKQQFHVFWFKKTHHWCAIVLFTVSASTAHSISAGKVHFVAYKFWWYLWSWWDELCWWDESNEYSHFRWSLKHLKIYKWLTRTKEPQTVLYQPTRLHFYSLTSYW